MAWNPDVSGSTRIWPLTTERLWRIARSTSLWAAGSHSRMHPAPRAKPSRMARNRARVALTKCSRRSVSSTAIPWCIPSMPVAEDIARASVSRSSASKARLRCG